MVPVRSRRPSPLLAVLALLAPLLGAVAPPAQARVEPRTWHRHNVYEPGSPSHERLRCLTDGVWRCKYDTVPEPTLGFSDPAVKATFVGTEVTGAECPDWFTTELCTSVVRVVVGTQTFVLPGEGELFTVDVALLVTEDGDLWSY